MKRESYAQPVELGWASLPWHTVRSGVFGMWANAFLAGAFDNAATINSWHQHYVFARGVHRFRLQTSLSLEAICLAEWLCLIRSEGATAIVIQTIPTHTAPTVQQSSTGDALLALRQTGDGWQVASAWAGVTEQSRASFEHKGGLPYSYPIGYEMHHVESCWIRLVQAPALIGVPKRDESTLQCWLDSLFASACHYHYALPELAEPQSRIRSLYRFLNEWARSRHCKTERYPTPLFPGDSQSAAMRALFLQAGLLHHQLLQRPSIAARHPYDNDAGPIHPPHDPRGEVFAKLEAQLALWLHAWNEQCFTPWVGVFDTPGNRRCVASSTGDLTVQQYDFPGGESCLDGVLDWWISNDGEPNLG
ncbi:hypothetical protein [Chitinolyticbacter albus]|uniref:hypothetical protein n=1 Tax=Chitinolyticbacter albus TaxID=2961951 RepID=UPI002109765A|nr:hypothetical protein [Chitinolyticbacter albus]